MNFNIPDILKIFLLRRVHVAVLVFLGLTTNYMLRVNINMAIEYMVDEDSLGPTIVWTKDQQESIKSAFFIGYFILQVPGGRLAEIYGTKRVFGYCMFLCTVLGALTPVLSTSFGPSVSVPLIVTLRILQGFTQAVCFPSCHPLTNRWVPDQEKGKFISFAYMGGTFGSVITFPLAGLVIKNMSWEWVFYLSSILTLVWFVLWMVFLSDFPKEDRFITEKERDIILESRSYDPVQLVEDRKIPFIPLVCDIIKTPAVWVDMIGDLCNGFGLYVLLTEGPAFFKNVFGYDSQTVGLACAAPQLARTIYGLIIGAVSDWVIQSGKLSRLNMQKVNVCVGFLIPSAGMVVMSYLTHPDFQVVGLAVMVLTFGFNGCTMSGHIQNILFLGPNRSGTLYGVTNGFGNLSGFLVPQIKALLVSDDTDINSWRNLYFIAAGLYIFISIYFVMAASSKIQEFNNKSYNDVTTAKYLRSEANKIKSIVRRKKN